MLRTGLQSGPGGGGAALLLQVFLVLLGSLSAVQEHSDHPHLQGLNRPKRIRAERRQTQDKSINKFLNLATNGSHLGKKYHNNVFPDAL